MFKKSTTKQSKAILALSIALIALIAFTSAITFAYFTNSNTATDNGKLEFGTLSVTANDFGISSTETSAHGGKIIPGCTIGLNGTISTTGIDSYIRVKFDASAATVTGVKEGDTTTAGALKTLLSTTMATELGKVSGWVANGDYVYYVAKVTSADSVNLSDAVIELDPKVYGNDYQGVSITGVKLIVEAVQADHATVDGADAGAVDKTNIFNLDAWDADITSGKVA